jgi:aspartyl-tRNA(Asn)/glutamyl-tRNA(Gln) amidotransferase subunit B
MRSKEEASDYRYFPDPDLVLMRVEKERVTKLGKRLPEMPDSRRQRYVERWGLPDYDAALISSSLDLAEYFEATVAICGDAKSVSNWVMVEIFRR